MSEQQILSEAQIQAARSALLADAREWGKLAVQVAIVTEERVSVPKSDIAAASPAREAPCGKKDEYEAEENVKEVGEDDQVAHHEKLKYRAIPSLFSEERCRTAKFEGVHTR
jgi:hypothetical protein